VTIRSEPSGAKVYLDGEYKGTTPCTVELRHEVAPVDFYKFRFRREKLVSNFPDPQGKILEKKKTSSGTVVLQTKHELVLHKEGYTRLETEMLAPTSGKRVQKSGFGWLIVWTERGGTINLPDGTIQAEAFRGLSHFQLVKAPGRKSLTFFLER
jgi:hypothetical protein